MIENKPSIYNAQSVYNQGGGGGVFTVDLGGGVSQELTFPPYLVPVEYLDNSDATNGFFTLVHAWQFQPQSTDFFEAKISFNTSKIIVNGERIFGTTYSLGHNGSNANWDFSVQASKKVSFNYGNVQTSVTQANLHTDDFILVQFNAPTKTLLVTDNYGNSGSNTSSSAYSTDPWGLCGVMGLPQQSPNYPFHGKFFHAYIKNKYTNKIRALWLIAKMKDNSSQQPYIVECVSGTVGINRGKDWGTTGIVFGPEIDLSDIGNYFQ